MESTALHPASFMNCTALPATALRTDDFKMVTEGK
jgi:hypothetical protein